jgi:hypothetical protein
VELSKEAKARISKKIAHLQRSGEMPRRQAIAVAHRMELAGRLSDTGEYRPVERPAKEDVDRLIDAKLSSIDELAPRFGGEVSFRGDSETRAVMAPTDHLSNEVTPKVPVKASRHRYGQPSSTNKGWRSYAAGAEFRGYTMKDHKGRKYS